MRIGVAREIKPREYRVALTPAGALELVQRGHEVIVEEAAGVGSGFADEAYVAVGARIAPVDEVWDSAELLLKVKEPIAEEYERLREDLTLFTYLHIAADEPLTRALVDSGITGIAYETVETASRQLPLLAPMSEVAGRLAPQMGAWSLEKAHGGRGILLGGVPGVPPAKVVDPRRRRRRPQLGDHRARHAGGRLGARQVGRADARARDRARRPRHARDVEPAPDRGDPRRRRHGDRRGARSRGRSRRGS